MNNKIAALLAAVVLLPALARAGEAEKFYAAKCAMCHAKDGKGNEKMVKMLKTTAADLNLIDEGTLAKKDADLAKLILDGKNKMPAYKDKLKGVTVDELVAYFRGLKPSAKGK